jgi:hypothetical protein
MTPEAMFISILGEKNAKGFTMIYLLQMEQVNWLATS